MSDHYTQKTMQIKMHNVTCIDYNLKVKIQDSRIYEKDFTDLNILSC
jgi:hypothetical protein